MATASAYAFGAMPPPCALTQMVHTSPRRPSPSAASLVMRSLCRVMASTSPPPILPAIGPLGPTRPLLHASSTMTIADWQSHSSSTRSPALCRASVLSIANSSATWLLVPGGSAPPRASLPSHDPHPAARAPISSGARASASSALPSVA